MARAHTPTTDATTADASTSTDDVSATVETKVREFNKLTPGSLAATDISTLNANELAEYASAAKARLEDLTSSVYADKRTGVVYLGKKQIGNVNRPIKASTVIPSQLRAKDEHVTAGGEVNLPNDAIVRGLTTLDTFLIAAIRFSMARISGNGVNLIGQRTKDDIGAANALGSVKSAMA